MATRKEFSDFLQSTERRAFRQAMFAVRDEALSLDLVQDAMLRLVEKYSDRPAAELPPLFQRILHNLITDHFRRQKARSLWTVLLSPATGADGDDGGERDPLEMLETSPTTSFGRSGADELERGQLLAILEEEIARLPARQREAFLLRYWEEMDVAETAAVMGCSEGSVKTHCSRANHALAAALRARGISS
ncbi:MAG: RNA polymerase sigma factor [Burkholderiaceae bacterium]